jgi:hypothetical protein
MGKPKAMFLVRGGDGRMTTILATSHRAAANIYIEQYKAARGEAISVKERGQGDWHEFEAK